MTCVNANRVFFRRVGRPIGGAKNLFLALCFASNACLSNPSPREEQPDITTNIAKCEAINVGSGTSFQEAPARLEFRDALVADLNCDQVDDLVVQNADDTNPGIYVLLGRSSGFGQVYDAFIPVPEGVPRGLFIGNVLGNPYPDILVYASKRNGASIALYEGGDGLAFDKRIVRDLGSHFVPIADPAPRLSPVHIAPGHFYPDSDAKDIVFGDLKRVSLLRVDEWTQKGVEEHPVVPYVQPNLASWASMSVLPISRGDSLDDFLVIEYNSATWAHNSGEGTFPKEQAVVLPSFTAEDSTFAIADMDGEGLSEVVVGTEDRALAIRLRLNFEESPRSKYSKIIFPFP